MLVVYLMAWGHGISRGLKCDCPNTIPYTEVQYTERGVGDVATYTCQDGYFPEDASVKSICQSSGTWTSASLTCTQRKTAIACEWEYTALSCFADQKIDVVSVNYGRTDKTTCPHSAMSNIDCRSGPAATTYVEGRCNDRTACTVQANYNILGGDPCQGTYKYLHVVYDCYVY